MIIKDQMKHYTTLQNTLERLKLGNTNFISDSLSHRSQNSSRRKDVIDGQKWC